MITVRRHSKADAGLASVLKGGQVLRVTDGGRETFFKVKRRSYSVKLGEATYELEQLPR